MLPFIRDLKKVAVSPLYLLAGNCRFFKDRAVQAISDKQAIPPPARYRLEALPAEEVRDQVGVRSFVERKKLFVWEEFDRFCTPTQEFLRNAQEWLPTGHVLVLETQDRKNAIPEKSLTDLETLVPVVHCFNPRESRGEVAEWVRYNLQGKELSDPLVQEIAQNYASDLYLLDAEIEKLRRYPGQLDADVVRNLVALSDRTDLYTLLDMIALRNSEGALRVLSLLLGSTPLGDILASVTKFLSQMMAVGFLTQKGKDTPSMSDTLGLSQAQVQRLRAAVPRFSVQSLVHALNQLAQIDLASRREGDPESLLHRIVYLLCSNPDSLVTKYRRGLR